MGGNRLQDLSAEISDCGVLVSEPSSNILPDVRKIAVLRANGIGDYLFAVPALEALKATYPDAELTLLGKSWHRQFVHGRPGPVDRVVVVPPWAGVTEGNDHHDDPNQRSEFLKAMQAEEFDMAIQMHEEVGSLTFWLMGSAQR